MKESTHFSLNEIAKMYYEQGLTQDQIAKRCGISRPMISRKLRQARENGIVRIFIAPDDNGVPLLEEKLQSFFSAKLIRVAQVAPGDEELAVELTARLGAEVFASFVEQDDRIGVAWGWTLKQLCHYFPPCGIQTELVVQCTGNLDDLKSNSSPDGMIHTLAGKLGAARARALSVPALVDSPVVAHAMQQEKRLQQGLLDIGNCNVFFVSVGLPDESTCLYTQEYLTDDDLVRLKEMGAVGSICCRFYNKDGEICDPETDARTLGVSLAQLRNAQKVMCCVSGEQKAYAVYCALRAKLFDVIVMDSLLAEQVLRYAEDTPV